MRKITRAGALAVATALALTACGDAPDESAEPADDSAAPADDAAEPADDAGEEPADDAGEEPTAEPVDFTACQITDVGGVDDRSFNQTVYAGFQRAEQELGISIEVLESQSEADFEPNLQTFIDQDCDLIVTVGFLLDAATQAAAQANPDQQFAIVDVDFAEFDDAGEFVGDVEYDNVRELTFQTDQAAFLAGYVAAAQTESGTVGTYGGLPIPTVTIFMDGFLAGVNYHNEQNGTDVTVEGWSGDPESGLFTGNFESQDDGRNLTDQLLQAGADIIMPVAGPVGLGTVTAIEDFGSGSIIWVDTDGFVSVEQAGSLMLTSVQKQMDVAAFDTIEAALNDSFEGGLYTGTLENEGVGIAPFHDFEGEIDPEVTAALDEIRAGIIAGDIEVSPTAAE